MRTALKTNLSTEAHEALADGIRIMVENMGPHQRADIAKELTAAAGDYSGRAAQLLLRLARYVESAAR